jgi:hypothetical protein
MSNYIGSIPAGRFVFIAMQDSGSTYIAAAANAMRSLGATDPIIGFRASYVLVGCAGFSSGNCPGFTPYENGAARYVGPTEYQRDITFDTAAFFSHMSLVKDCMETGGCIDTLGGASCEYTCDEAGGFMPSGPLRRACLTNGDWDTGIPLQCGNTPPILHDLDVSVLEGSPVGTWIGEVCEGVKV